MFRSMLCSMVMLGAFVSFSAASPEKTVSKDTDKKGKEAKITKVDTKKKTVTVKSTDDANAAEKTFKLAEEIEYVDSTGKTATIEIFTLGDTVLYIEADGKISKLTKCDKSDKKKPESK